LFKLPARRCAFTADCRKAKGVGQLIVGISEHRFDASDRDGTLTTLGDIDGLPSTVGFNGIAAL